MTETSVYHYPFVLARPGEVPVMCEQHCQSPDCYQITHPLCDSCLTELDLTVNDFHPDVRIYRCAEQLCERHRVPVERPVRLGLLGSDGHWLQLPIEEQKHYIATGRLIGAATDKDQTMNQTSTSRAPDTGNPHGIRSESYDDSPAGAGGPIAIVVDGGIAQPYFTADADRVEILDLDVLSADTPVEENLDEVIDLYNRAAALGIQIPEVTRWLAGSGLVTPTWTHK